MNKRIAITALTAAFAASSLLGALAKPALADADDHAVRHHNHVYVNSGWHRGQAANGQYTGYRNPNGSWVNGKQYGNGYNVNGTWNGNRRADRDDHKRWGDRDDRKHRDRDDRKHHHHDDR